MKFGIHILRKKTFNLIPVSRAILLMSDFSGVVLGCHYQPPRQLLDLLEDASLDADYIPCQSHHFQKMHISIRYFPQHFLYFLPLPHEHGSFRPIVITLYTVLVFSGFLPSNFMKSDVSSSLSGSIPITTFQPLSSQTL